MLAPGRSGQYELDGGRLNLSLVAESNTLAVYSKLAESLALGIRATLFGGDDWKLLLPRCSVRVFLG